MLLSLLALGLSPAILRGIEFAPTFIETPVEGGFVHREVVLKDGANRVVYCPPAGWQAEAGERFLRFRPQGATLADLTIDAEKAAAGRILEAAEIARCRDWLKASIPPESTNVVDEPDEVNPGSVANYPTIGMTMAYTNKGFRYRKRAIVVFAYDAEIRFTIVAKTADFDRLYPAVRRSLFSWRWERAR